MPSHLCSVCSPNYPYFELPSASDFRPSGFMQNFRTSLILRQNKRWEQSKTIKGILFSTRNPWRDHSHPSLIMILSIYKQSHPIVILVAVWVVILPGRFLFPFFISDPSLEKINLFNNKNNQSNPIGSCKTQFSTFFSWFYIITLYHH